MTIEIYCVPAHLFCKDEFCPRIVDNQGMYSLAQRDLLQNFYFASLLHNMALHEVSTPETEMHDVQLLKNDLGLGITVAGYVCDEENLSGIFIKSICTGSAADLTGNIHINDRIVKVNGKSVTALNNYQAIDILRKSGPTVVISLERYLRGPKYDRLQQTTCSNSSPSPPETPQSTLMLLGNSERSSQDEKFLLSGTTKITEETKNVSSNNDNVYNKFKVKPPPLHLDTSINSNNINNSFEKQDLLVHVVAAPAEFNDLVLISDERNNENDNNFDQIQHMAGEECEKIGQLIINTDNSVNSDSSCIYFSKTSDDTEKDGYETCIDESFSDDIYSKLQSEIIHDDVKCEIRNDGPETGTPETLTPTAHNISFHNIFSNADLNTASSEPALNTNNANRLSTKDCLKRNSCANDNLKSYKNPSEFKENADFFVIQCLDDSINDYNVNKYLSESNIVNSYVLPPSATYKCLKLQEYYNDYKDCLEEYNIVFPSQDEVLENTSQSNQTAICSNIINEDIINQNELMVHTLAFKSISEPYIPGILYDCEYLQRRFSILTDYENRRNR